jgi:hypothetical protein
MCVTRLDVVYVVNYVAIQNIVEINYSGSKFGWYQSNSCLISSPCVFQISPMIGGIYHPIRTVKMETCFSHRSVRLKQKFQLNIVVYDFAVAFYGCMTRYTQKTFLRIVTQRTI